MNKEQLLRELNQKIKSGEVSRDEVLRSLSKVDADKQAGHKMREVSTKLLYVIGAAIIIIGVIILIAQVWDDINSFERTVLTFGLGLLMVGGGAALIQDESHEHNEQLGTAFHSIGGVLLPIGAAVLISEYELAVNSLWPAVLIYFLIFGMYLWMSQIQKYAVVTFFAIASGTTVAYLLLGALVQSYNAYNYGDLYAYLTMVIGANYISIARILRGKNKSISGFLDVAGSIALLGAAFSQVIDSSAWEMFYFLILFGALFMSVYIKSRMVLAVSTIFLIIYISYITSQYFADSLGWPVLLVFLGFMFIGLGYASVSISKKYIED